jgi:hypothetical protein
VLYCSDRCRADKSKAPSTCPPFLNIPRTKDKA